MIPILKNLSINPLKKGKRAMVICANCGSWIEKTEKIKNCVICNYPL